MAYKANDVVDVKPNAVLIRLTRVGFSEVAAAPRPTTGQLWPRKGQ